MNSFPRAPGDRARQPGLGGSPYATPALWAVIQYLGRREVAPEHDTCRIRFDSWSRARVWTIVDGDPVAMRRCDFLLTPGRHFHGPDNVSDQPMAWIDGLGIRFVYSTDAAFFDYRAEQVSDSSTLERTRSARLWAHPGLRSGTRTVPRREVGSAVRQVFEGAGTVRLGDWGYPVDTGDRVVVSSWAPLTLKAHSGFVLFRFSNTPIFERLHQDREHVEGAE